MARENKSAKLLANLASGADQARQRSDQQDSRDSGNWPGFVHLRVHSAYSLLEGALPIKTLIKRAVADDQPALAITDTNNLFGALEFSVKAMEAGIQPVIGCQLDIDMEDGQGGDRRSHRDHLQKPPSIVLYAATPAGYDRLVALVSRAYLGGDSSERPHIMLSWLEEGAEGLIALTGATGGPVDKPMRDGHPEQARARLDTLRRVFGDGLYLELQRQSGYDRTHEAKMIALAYEAEVPLVATNEAFFPAPGDFEAHDALMAVACNAVMSDDRRPRLSVDNCLKSRAEMTALFADIPEALENTIEIARRCSAIVERRAPILPRFTGGGEENPEAALAAEAAELRRQSIEGLDRRLERIGLAEGYTEADYRERLKTELDIIENMKFPGYFLIVADFIKWAKEQDIPVGPGRGSGAGSLVAYALTITDVDPLRFSLLFERFLNPARVSMPDFDIDFCQDRREEVIRYVQRKYGREQVGQIITFGSCRPVLRCAMSAAFWKCPTGWSTASASWCPTTLPIRPRSTRRSRKSRGLPRKWRRSRRSNACSISPRSSRGSTVTHPPTRQVS
jgi:DNA polymerase-3 subunit alpha